MKTLLGQQGPNTTDGAIAAQNDVVAYVEISASGTSFVGADATSLFRLMSLRSALKLETKGLRLSRGVSALAIAKRETGLRTNNRFTQLKALDSIIDDARARIPVVQK